MGVLRPTGHHHITKVPDTQTGDDKLIVTEIFLDRKYYEAQLILRVKLSSDMQL